MESPTIDPHIPGIYCLVSQLRVTCFEASGSDNALSPLERDWALIARAPRHSPTFSR